MIHVGWIQIDNSKDQYKFGGSIYNDRSRKVIAEFADLRTYPVALPVTKSHSYMQLPHLFLSLSKIRGSNDIWIRDFYSAISTLFDHTKGKNVVLIHHIDTTTLSRSLKIFFSLYTNLFYLALRRCDAIVVMSDYWKNHFLRLGFQNVYTIYNPIDFDKDVITPQDIRRFKKTYKITEKPVIYLGNCRAYKGVVQAYEALKDLDVQFITSGHKDVSLPVKNLLLTHKEQLILQRISTIAIAMSLFKEGWSMTVHESMYMKTPVIGSGQGGMQELLKGGNQILCNDFSHLKAHVQKLLNNPILRRKMGEDGHKFAKQFTRVKFEKAWDYVLHDVYRKL